MHLGHFTTSSTEGEFHHSPITHLNRACPLSDSYCIVVLNAYIMLTAYKFFLLPHISFSLTSSKKIDFQGFPLWFFITFKIFVRIKDKYIKFIWIFRENQQLKRFPIWFFGCNGGKNDILTPVLIHPRKRENWRTPSIVGNWHISLGNPGYSPGYWLCNILSIIIWHYGIMLCFMLDFELRNPIIIF